LPAQSLQQLPATNDVRQLIRQIVALADQSLERVQTPLHMAQKTMQSLYRTNSQLGRETYVFLLNHLCHNFGEAGKEAINWLLNSDDEVCCFSRSLLDNYR
jgi:CCR4-NOT transcription complex subunit 1